jgi:hypothetical protein
MADEAFSFRWGIPLLDQGYTDIPNFFFDHYTAAGVTRMEFLTILHLARYQFEREGSECRPSVGTVAAQMGVTGRRLQQILAGLEARALLARHYRLGDTTVYDFSGFSRAILARTVDNSCPERGETDFRGEGYFTPRGEADFRGGAKESSPKEEHEEEHPRSGGGLTNEQEQALSLLLDFGISRAVARKLTAQCTLDQVQSWIAYVEGARGVKDPVALVVARLQAGELAPSVRQESSGKTALMCTQCSLVRPIQFICPDCGCCFDCCECEEVIGDE